MLVLYVPYVITMSVILHKTNRRSHLKLDRSNSLLELLVTDQKLSKSNADHESVLSVLTLFRQIRCCF